MNTRAEGAQERTVLRAEELGRTVGSKVILRDISFDVMAGELLGIVGASGSGKSSLLRLLNRLDEPTSGTVFLDDQDYRQLPPRELRRRVGMVTQRPYLFPGDAASNLRFGPAQRGETVDEASKMVIEKLIVSLVGDHGLTCVMVTHDRDQARRMCQRVILLEAGRLVQSGTAVEVLGA